MNELNITQNLILRKHKIQSALPVRERDWKKIEQMISDIHSGNSMFQIMASLVFGIFLAILSALLLQELSVGLTQSTYIIGGNFVVSVIIGIGFALLILNRQQSRNMEKSKQNVINEMDMVQQDYKPVPMETTVTAESDDSGASVAEQFLK